DAELLLVESIDLESMMPPLGDLIVPEMYERLRSNLRRQASQYLARVAEDLPGLGGTVSWSVLEGPQAASLARAGRRNDIIVLPAPAHNGLVRWLPGSLVETVMRESAAMVLLSPTPARRARSEAAASIRAI
ncbi:MAG: hypothetical protein ACR2J8_12310, partial [Thermomicrobiales bacterium]